MIYAFVGLAFTSGLLVGFALWDVIDRTKWAAYRAVYRHARPSEDI
jgi:hypothetical protein